MSLVFYVVGIVGFIAWIYLLYVLDRAQVPAWRYIAGSGGGGSSTKKDTLYTNSTNSNPSTITLSNNFNEYDMLSEKEERYISNHIR